MKRLLAAALCFACAVGLASSADASVKSLLNIRWVTNLGGGSAQTDSALFSRVAGTAATRDTSMAIPIMQIAPPRSSGGVGDSTMWCAFNIYPDGSASTVASGDSAYAYLEFSSTGEDDSWTVMTNGTEILALEGGTGNGYVFPITWGRRPQTLGAYDYVRIIVRGDFGGHYMGHATFYTEENVRSR